MFHIFSKECLSWGRIRENTCPESRMVSGHLCAPLLHSPCSCTSSQPASPSSLFISPPTKYYCGPSSSSPVFISQSPFQARQHITVKRLMKEAAELRDPTEHYHAQPLEDNLFEWHFSVRGPPDSDFDGGVYHGRIVLPPEYPMKPPSIILLTPNGRFEVGKKICLSISGHHPETWQPSWSIRTALIAIIGFMPTKGEGAIGSLDYTPEERRALAKKSQDFCCEACGGGSMRSALLALTPNSDPSAEDDQAKELAQQINFKEESSLSRQPSESGGAESEPSTSPQGDSSSSAEQQESEGPRAEQVGVTLPPHNI
ncbi:hypothetical protein NQZ68_008403 [Dissostichus eleginoides]|nr:hypothetical protein NQZ68_008403 [Dissostichus eleginoides]